MSGSYLEKIKFLIVDDNAFMRTIVRRVLFALDVSSIEEASNGDEAIRLLATFPPDIAIVDWEMEPLDGLEFVRIVRTSEDSPNPFLPIIMLSAHSEHNRIIVARDAGVNEFLVKPLSAKNLFERIEAVIEKPRPFVRSKDYFGPDRRRKAFPYSPERRRDRKTNENNAVPNNPSPRITAKPVIPRSDDKYP